MAANAVNAIVFLGERSVGHIINYLKALLPIFQQCISDGDQLSHYIGEDWK